MTAERSRAMRYLLGTLPEQERDALASEMFTDDETFSALIPIGFFLAIVLLLWRDRSSASTIVAPEAKAA